MRKLADKWGFRDTNFPRKLTRFSFQRVSTMTVEAKNTTPRHLDPDKHETDCRPIRTDTGVMAEVPAHVQKLIDQRKDQSEKR